MPYRINKLKKSCKQSDGDVGHWTLTYTDKNGKHHRICHTSKKNAEGQIAAIEGPKNDAHTKEEEKILEKVFESLLELNNG